MRHAETAIYDAIKGMKNKGSATSKKHMAYRKKHKAYILKYKALILK